MLTRLSVILPTFDRAASLGRAVAALLDQTVDPAIYELIVVDNNSSDGTRALLASIADPRLRVIEEPRQGLSYARNAGLTAARGDAVAFTDDDVEVSRDWVSTILEALDGDDGIDGVGGRVMPSWRGHPPAWLTREHWAPLALQDHGDEVRTFDAAHPIGLVGANFAFRREVFTRIGTFSPDVQRVKEGVGSTEDHELLTRLYSAGGRMRYIPAMIVKAPVQAERCTRSYHRRWHLGHGGYHAQMRLPETERSRAHVLGIPSHLFRSAATDTGRLLACLATGKPDRAFVVELRLRFAWGFVKTRLARRWRPSAVSLRISGWLPAWLTREEP